MNQRTAPDDEELARLIHAAFEALPGPDEDRLAAVGERVVHQAGTQKKTSRNRRHSWYWLWLLLAGGTVAAAWWVNDYMNKSSVTERTTEQQREQTQVMPQPINNNADAKPDEATRKSEQESRVEQESPVIYKREGY